MSAFLLSTKQGKHPTSIVPFKKHTSGFPWISTSGTFLSDSVHFECYIQHLWFISNTLTFSFIDHHNINKVIQGRQNGHPCTEYCPKSTHSTCSWSGASIQHSAPNRMVKCSGMFRLNGLEPPRKLLLCLVWQPPKTAFLRQPYGPSLPACIIPFKWHSFSWASGCRAVFCHHVFFSHRK